MSLRIHNDQSRFKDIVRGKIKQNLKNYIQKGELIGKQGKDKITIPVPRIDLPQFRFGDKAKAVWAKVKANLVTQLTVNQVKAKANPVKQDKTLVITH